MTLKLFGFIEFATVSQAKAACALSDRHSITLQRASDSTQRVLLPKLSPYSGPADGHLQRIQAWIADCATCGIVPTCTSAECVLDFEETTTQAWCLCGTRSTEVTDLTDHWTMAVLEYDNQPWALRELLDGCEAYVTASAEGTHALIPCNALDNECLLATECVRSAMLQLGIPEDAFRRVHCADKYVLRDVTPGTVGAFEHGSRQLVQVVGIIESERATRGLNWYMFAPRRQMPLQHPSLRRYNRRYIAGDPRQVEYPCPERPCTWMGTNVSVWSAVYDADTWRANWPVTLARVAESTRTESFAGSLVADEKHRDLVSRFLVSPLWRRVGVLPLDTTLLHQEPVEL
jgi:hypothetical protein